MHGRVRAKVFCGLADLKGGLRNPNGEEVGLYGGIRSVFTDVSGRHILREPVDADIYHHERHKKVISPQSHG